ncbi:peptide chain release factor H [Grimontia sp. AD028]|uniref:peptide chain release factor H n=1 Tax=Grimontia sp. AD028 TaxID=1581149 RepID=UPI00061ABD9A|nr:peptide chain release factor H [Grimontia sp. AD028]KKD60768.1 peptide chain release factor H [Grimontia sp. AD028]
MILLQLSAGQGPLECCKAVGLALSTLEKQCADKAVSLEVVEAVSAGKSGCYKSVLVRLDATAPEAAKQLATDWQGPMLWVFPSPFRPRHKRKNWFFGGETYEVDESDIQHHFRFRACRASGAGGQHVNTTSSAIRATHVESGLSVRVESERSQHANKRLAVALLYKKLEDEKQASLSAQTKSRRQQHWELERGNPVKVFKGPGFTPS